MRQLSASVTKLAIICATAFLSTSGFSETPQDAISSGEYLAIAGNCVSCHTAPGGSAFAGGVRFATEFGNIYSTNITSHKEAGIGSWTLTDFTRAMRKGVNAKGEHLYPAFPYTSYALMTDEDIASLWEYIQTIPASDQPARENKLAFPYNQRKLMAAWNMLFLDSEPYVSDGSKSAEWNRGAYLVKGPAHCGACHTPRNRLGAEIQDRFLQGGLLTDITGPRQKLRSWYAVDLTPSANGLGNWSKSDLMTYLKSGVSAVGTTFGPMNEVIGNSTRHLQDEDIEAIVTYLQDIPGSPPSPSSPSQAQMVAGASLYDIYCGTCHLPTGLGIEGSSPPLMGSAIVNSMNPSSLINVILYGANKPTHWTPSQQFDKVMEPYGGDLRDDEVVNIVNFIRGSWGNSAPPVTRDQVSTQR